MLGKQAIQRYYEGILSDHPGSFHCKLEEDGRIVGFCFGGVFGPGGAVATLLHRHKYFLARQVMKRPWLIVSNPLFRNRLQRGIRTVLRLPLANIASASRPAPIFRVLAIATHPDVQGQGFGKLLMNEAEKIAISCGQSEIGLTVDPKNNRAVMFYERLGWQRIESKDGWTGGMWKPLPKPAMPNPSTSPRLNA